MTTPTKPALPEPDAYLQIGMEGSPNEGDRIARTYLPKHYDKTWWRFEPLYTQAAIDAAVAEARAVPGEGWTDADADAARLALDLECLLTDKDVPMATISRWWDSAHEALDLHRQRLRAAIEESRK